MSDRICYWLDETLTDRQGHYVPGLVVENESGYYEQTKVVLAMDLAAAKVVVEGLNADMGITPEDARDIIGSSMRLGNIKDDHG